jgi:hypothetical protein
MITRRQALSGIASVSVTGAATAASALPGSPAPEVPCERVRRLGHELSQALADFSAESGDVWIAHVYPARKWPFPIMLENVDNAATHMPKKWDLALPGRAVRSPGKIEP